MINDMMQLIKQDLSEIKASMSIIQLGIIPYFSPGHPCPTCSGFVNLCVTVVNVCKHLSVFLLRHPRSIAKELADWLIHNNVVEHIFGPNLHIEVRQ